MNYITTNYIIMNGAAVNILLPVLGWIYIRILVGSVQRSGIAGLWVNTCSTLVDIAGCVIIFNGEAT